MVKIKIENIKKTFNPRSRNKNQVLKGVSFDLPEKGLVAIFGKSGSGKTTLLNIIGGLERQDGGRIYIDGENVAGSSGNVYYVKSVRLPIDSLRESYKLALYINSSVMGVQFCEPNEAVSTGTYSATLTLDLASGQSVGNIDDRIGSETRGDAPAA